ncbi:unnamed protein product [Rotaria sp. Silwood1]|nr:unnamed protein product [Rotaria sp. Silwood1]
MLLLPVATNADYTTDSIASSYCPFDQRKQNEFYQSTGDEITKLQQQNFHHLLSNVESTYSSNDNYLSKYTIDDNNSQIKAIRYKSNAVSNQVWPCILQEIRPTLNELGISTPEDLGYDKSELTLKSIDDM